MEVINLEHHILKAQRLKTHLVHYFYLGIIGTTFSANFFWTRAKGWVIMEAVTFSWLFLNK